MASTLCRRGVMLMCLCAPLCMSLPRGAAPELGRPAVADVGARAPTDASNLERRRGRREEKGTPKARPENETAPAASVPGGAPPLSAAEEARQRLWRRTSGEQPAMSLVAISPVRSICNLKKMFTRAPN